MSRSDKGVASFLGRAVSPALRVDPPTSQGGTKPRHSRRQTRLITRRTNIMEIERINALGNTLIDLATRTHELRGYL